MFEWMKRRTCSIGGKCSGCDLITKSRSNQLLQKVAILRTEWKQYTEAPLPSQISVLKIRDKELAIVVDVSFQRNGNNTILGFYDIEREKLLNAAPCPALIPDLQVFLTELSRDPPPIKQILGLIKHVRRSQRSHYEV